MELGELITDHKGARSYTDLERDCGGSPKAARLQQLATQPLKNFPDPPTIRHLAAGLRVRQATVVMAAAQSLGLDVRSAAPNLLDRLPPGVEDLTDSQVHTIVDLAWSFVRLNASEDSHQFFLTEMFGDLGVSFFDDITGTRISRSDGVARLMRIVTDESQVDPDAALSFYDAIRAGVDHIGDHVAEGEGIVLAFGEPTDTGIGLTIENRVVDDLGAKRRAKVSPAGASLNPAADEPKKEVVEEPGEAQYDD